MKTVSRRDRKLSLILAVTVLILAILACGKTTDSDTGVNSTSNDASNPGIPGSNQDDSSSQLACLAGITPGTTNRSEVITLLGEPLAAKPDGEYETLLYASPLPRQYNSIILQNQVVVFVSVVLDEDNPLVLSAILEKYGEPAHKTYSNYQQGSLTYIYADNGQAIVASPEVDAVFIRQCFIPMAVKEYMKIWGSSLPSEDPFTR